MPICKRLFFLLIFLFSYAFSAEHELLKTADVNKVMQNILQQHVSQKKISDQILKTSFKVYIDQFDPDRTYLLETETTPFLNVNDKQAQQLLKQYLKSDFGAYSRLNSMIQGSILRARKIRQNLIKNPKQLFLYQNPKDAKSDWEDPDLKRPFVRGTNELMSRIKQDMVRFINAEINHYGAAKVQKNEQAILAFYENKQREKEDKYLFRNTAGRDLAKPERENLFVMHILKALTRSLDAHTTFYDASEAYDMKMRLEKGVIGVGLVPQETEDGMIVARIIQNGPAAKNGQIQLDDQIVKINGKDATNQSFDQVMHSLQAKPGSVISMVLKKPATPDNDYTSSIYHVDLTSEAISIDEGRAEASYESFEDGVLGVVTLNSFYQGIHGINSELDVRKALNELTQKGKIRGLVLDLRENSGGFLSQAVKVAGLFITNGVIVISKYSNGEERFYRDMDGKAYYNGPLIVLTSKATASAAEIVAQALQDYGVALVVGDEQTYGKGTIQSQTVTDNKGSSYFKVTVGKYYTVSGKTPQIQGVKADVIVPSQFSRENIGEEFLEYPLTHDTISSAYEDLLEDIDPTLKPWYLRYYSPTLQHKIRTWRTMLPVLRKNSAHRLVSNTQYQKFLTNQDDASKVVVINSDDKTQPINTKDLQLVEAVNILKDMIYLQNSVHPTKKPAMSEK
ncbi:MULTISPECIES: tail-specific protease Tsp [Parachlamydia]|jgi:carboxyl-terminal processing protease|uniref:Tail-specific protease n=2 Tax=Parachlamydia acanthamoebae TaxID=83552 RepID=F8KXQ3_PARAV|nr:S41 family peptidase [Parachlamydia acanthamoebae]EFB41326.1 hypothetical protein pah_c045o021 [Parachlamydia acanthamoebae str. Hall's coccus]CCB85633.1 tail-specific protease [Parachlamydia acanthamoebae UV-7]